MSEICAFLRHISLKHVLAAGLATFGCAGCSLQGCDILQGAARDVEQGKVAYVEIYLLPTQIMTFAAIRSGDILRMAKPVRINGDDPLVRELLPLLREAGCEISDQKPDIRTAILLFDEKGRLLHGIYLGRPHLLQFTTPAMVNGRSVRLESGLEEWARSEVTIEPEN